MTHPVGRGAMTPARRAAWALLALGLPLAGLALLPPEARRPPTRTAPPRPTGGDLPLMADLEPALVPGASTRAVVEAYGRHDGAAPHEPAYRTEAPRPGGRQTWTFCCRDGALVLVFERDRLVRSGRK